MFGCINEFIFRGVVRIFSELRTILQIALHHSFLPEKKKLPWLRIWLRCKPKSFFSTYEMTLAAYEILCRVFGSIDWCTSITFHTIRLHTFPDSLLYFATGYVSSFLNRWSAWIRIEQVPISSSLYRFWNRNLKWIRCLVNVLTFCSVNNLANLSGYFSAFDNTSLQ